MAAGVSETAVAERCESVFGAGAAAASLAGGFGAAAGTGCGGVAAGPGCDRSVAPHMPQKRLLSGFSLPQRGQRTESLLMDRLGIAYAIRQVRCSRETMRFGVPVGRTPILAATIFYRKKSRRYIAEYADQAADLTYLLSFHEGYRRPTLRLSQTVQVSGVATF